MDLNKTENAVLVIDDEADVIKVVSEFLSVQNIDVMIALNGPDGIERAKKGQPDLIILDLRMPGMDGFEVCHQLKHDPATADIPIVCMTGMSDLDDKLKAFALGCVDYMVKPFHESELLARVSVHMQIQQLRRELADKNARLEGALETGNVVNVAIGVLMERNKIPREDAYEMIRGKARSERRKVSEVAGEILQELHEVW